MSKVRVLLADDHANMRGMVNGILDAHFEVVGEVADGKSLIEAALELNPDVIVTDISMPIMNGIEAVKKLKEYGCRSRIIFLTVHSSQDFVQACLEAGASGHVVKAQMASDLLEAIRAALAGCIFVSTDLAYPI